MGSKSAADFNQEETLIDLAKHLGVEVRQVAAAVQLLDAGNTIPFIARYRKEATRGLDEIALRAIEDAIEKARELSARKTTILKSIEEQGFLTEMLRTQILDCCDLQTLEAIYLPFKPKKRTRASIAREKGLQELADILAQQETLGASKASLLRRYVRPELEVLDEASALQGALDIIAEQWSEDLETRVWLTEEALRHGRIVSQVKRGKKEALDKFEMYADHRESVARIPSHRFLAIQRGEDEGILRVEIDLDSDRLIGKMQTHFVRNPEFAFHQDLLKTVEDSYERLLKPAIQSIVFQNLKERADEEAITVFGKNLRELLLAPPAGPKVTLGVDPGFRTGCKLAVVDGTGKYLAHSTIFPTPPVSDIATASRIVLNLIDQHKIELIAIGNGTASRETDAFVSQLIRDNNLTVTKVLVSESGASIYSASELAAAEYPNLDTTVRGAISIAHRLQDPLAELVKTDPKSIGVGQYQYDVNQAKLRRCLEREVESCVNSVGVDLNTASASLLSFVSGIGPKLAENIVNYRNANGQFNKRQQLLKIPKLGAKAFEQAAGFLRIGNGEEPLDNSAVHPESYRIVERMASALNVSSRKLVGNVALSQKLKPEEFVDEQFGLPTLIDIIGELAKPGRDPRKEFQAARFSDEVLSIEDLQVDMVLEGVVTNVTHFGAFVDIGVHHDALIHISQLSNTFIKNPNEVVAVGNVVKVRILEVDVSRKRISASKRF
jgi:protein Tex